MTLKGIDHFSGNLDNNIKHELELDLIGKHDSDSGQMEQVALVPHAAEVMGAGSWCYLWDIELFVSSGERIEKCFIS